MAAFHASRKPSEGGKQGVRGIGNSDAIPRKKAIDAQRTAWPIYQLFLSPTVRPHVHRNQNPQERAGRSCDPPHEKEARSREHHQGRSRQALLRETLRKTSSQGKGSSLYPDASSSLRRLICSAFMLFSRASRVPGRGFVF